MLCKGCCHYATLLWAHICTPWPVLGVPQAPEPDLSCTSQMPHLRVYHMHPPLIRNAHWIRLWVGGLPLKQLPYSGLPSCHPLIPVGWWAPSLQVRRDGVRGCRLALKRGLSALKGKILCPWPWPLTQGGKNTLPLLAHQATRGARASEADGGSEGKESACNSGDLGSIPGSGRSPGEGNGNPLEYSCLENPTNRGVWWVTVHEVSKNQTWLTFTFIIIII